MQGPLVLLVLTDDPFLSGLAGDVLDVGVGSSFTVVSTSEGVFSFGSDALGRPTQSPPYASQSIPEFQCNESHER